MAQTLDEKKFLAARRAQFALRQRYERIDFEDRLQREVQSIFKTIDGGKVLIEIEVGSEDQGL